MSNSGLRHSGMRREAQARNDEDMARPSIPATSNARVMTEPCRPENQRAQGMPGARCARSLACKNKSTQASHHGHTGDIRHSPRNGFNGFLRGLPGEPGLLSPSPPEKRWLLESLIPASGIRTPRLRRPRHPSSPKRLRRARRRSSFGTSASTASSAPRFVTIAKRPSCGQKTRGKVPVICPSSQVKRPAADWHDGQIR